MAYEYREGQGSLFKNDKQNERHPDFKGSIMIKGVMYNISAWSRTSQNGREYISLQAEERAEGDRPNRYQQQGGPYRQQGGYQQPVPSYQAPSYQAPSPAPAPTIEDMPSFGPDDDLPF